jgi:biopolymer transport protein TolR
MATEEDDVLPSRRRPPAESADVDITPMIDMTFQLLIFFMVTSTMQGNPPAIVPRSVSGGSTELGKMAFNLVIRSPSDDVSDPPMEIEKKPITMEDLRGRLAEESEARPAGIEIMIMGDRDVPNRFTSEIESMISEIPNVGFHYAVEDRRE